MSMVDDALEYLSETMLSTDVAGVAIIYTTKNDVSIRTTALPVGQGKDREYAVAVGNRPSESVFELLPPEKGYCGFLIRIDSLLADMDKAQPDRGDRILIDKGAYSEVYEVAAPKGTLPWRHEEPLPHKLHYRVHTKYKGKEYK